MTDETSTSLRRSSAGGAQARWPDLSERSDRETFATLHLWTQIVGKIRLETTPWTNHSWHVPLYVSPRGLETSTLWLDGVAFEMVFDLRSHALMIETSDGDRRSVPLAPGSVADFYAAVLAELRGLGLKPRIDTRPSEIEGGIRFERDARQRPYDPHAAQRLWRALLDIDRVFHRFRAAFLGKSSPVHFFWGSFDLAVTRFSGRTAPPHPGGVPALPDWVAREAYSHEVSSAGFWPGDPDGEAPLFYSYAYPQPDGFVDAVVQPSAARWSDALGEFVLPYADVRNADDPEAALWMFLTSTYEAAADRAAWDRAALERSPEDLPPPIARRLFEGGAD
ncbi:MAG: DUF5996 family protein [Acidobacteriota bacterium]